MAEDRPASLPPAPVPVAAEGDFFTRDGHPGVWEVVERDGIGGPGALLLKTTEGASWWTSAEQLTPERGVHRVEVAPVEAAPAAPNCGLCGHAAVLHYDDGRCGAHSIVDDACLCSGYQGADDAPPCGSCGHGADDHHGEGDGAGCAGTASPDAIFGQELRVYPVPAETPAWLRDAVLAALPVDGTPRTLSQIDAAIGRSARDYTLDDLREELHWLVKGGEAEQGPGRNGAPAWRRWGAPEPVAELLPDPACTALSVDCQELDDAQQAGDAVRLALLADRYLHERDRARRDLAAEQALRTLRDQEFARLVTLRNALRCYGQHDAHGAGPVAANLRAVASDWPADGVGAALLALARTIDHGPEEGEERPRSRTLDTACSVARELAEYLTGRRALPLDPEAAVDCLAQRFEALREQKATLAEPRSVAGVRLTPEAIATLEAVDEALRRGLSWASLVTECRRAIRAGGTS